ncbi:MAG TPA: hypothetical protein VHT05_01530, partial [Candidatus Elarobacter sp.]|nr:hypothetical protein [Candidatus Elarobacter sp.]
MRFKADWKPATGTGTYSVSTANPPYWHVTDSPIVSYDVTTGLAPVPLDPTTVQPDFYWTAASSGTAGDPLTLDTALVRSDGQETAFVHAYATYIVQAPTGTIATKSYQNPPVLAPASDPDTLVQGDPTKGYGITFLFTAKTPAGGAGHIGGTQTVWSQVTWVPDSISYDHGTNGATELDTCAFYSATVSVGASATGTWPVSVPQGDRPEVVIGQASASPLTDVRVQQYFNTFLMYRPTITANRKAVWIPLGNLAWQWASRAYRSSVTQPWGIGGVPGGNPSFTFVTPNSNSGQFPIYSGTYAPQAESCPA